MQWIELFSSELDREVARSRKALEQVPEGKHDWKPHDKSMIFGYLTEMVATIPTWVTMIVKQDELDIAPKGGRSSRGPRGPRALTTWRRWTSPPPMQGRSEEHQ